MNTTFRCIDYMCHQTRRIPCRIPCSSRCLCQLHSSHSWGLLCKKFRPFHMFCSDMPRIDQHCSACSRSCKLDNLPRMHRRDWKHNWLLLRKLSHLYYTSCCRNLSMCLHCLASYQPCTLCTRARWIRVLTLHNLRWLCSSCRSCHMLYSGIGHILQRLWACSHQNILCSLQTWLPLGFQHSLEFLCKSFRLSHSTHLHTQHRFHCSPYIQPCTLCNSRSLKQEDRPRNWQYSRRHHSPHTLRLDKGCRYHWQPCNQKHTLNILGKSILRFRFGSSRS